MGDFFLKAKSLTYKRLFSYQRFPTTFPFQPYKNRLFYFVNNLRYNKDSEKQFIKNVSL